MNESLASYEGVSSEDRHKGNLLNLLKGYFLDEGGSFAEYIITDARMVIPIPDTLPFEDAAGVGLCALTACQALWQVDRGLPTPENPTKDSIPVRPA